MPARCSLFLIRFLKGRDKTLARENPSTEAAKALSRPMSLLPGSVAPRKARPSRQNAFRPPLRDARAFAGGGARRGARPRAGRWSRRRGAAASRAPGQRRRSKSSRLLNEPSPQNGGSNRTEPALRRRLVCPRRRAGARRAEVKAPDPQARARRTPEGPAGHPRRGVAPQLQADVTGARKRAFAGRSRRYLMRTSRFKRVFCAGARFSAPPRPPRENNRVFNLSRS